MATQATTTSRQFTLNGRDVIKGLMVAILSPVVTILLTSLNAGSLVFDWKAIGAVALAAGLTYILKNFLTPTEVVITDPTAVQSIKDGDAVTVKKQ